MKKLIWAGPMLALLAACGGGDDTTAAAPAPAPAASASGAGTALACDTTAYTAGSVEAPSSAQLAAYAGTYNGDEGSYSMSGTFTRSGGATLVLGADASLSYKGTAYVVTSVCIEKSSGAFGRILYANTASGHFDISDQNNVGLGRAWGVSPADGSTVFTNGSKS